MGSLFGEFDNHKTDMGSSQKFTLSGLESLMQKGMGKAGQQYSQQGWGGRLHSPSVQSAIQKPWIEQSAETGRKAMTDLYFKDRNLDLSNRQLRFQSGQWEDQMHQQRKKMEGGKVICTELYRQGLLPFSHIKADLKYLKKYVSRETHENYLRWAVPFTKIMQKNKLVSLLIWLPVLCWSEYMKCVVYKKRLGIKAMVGFVWQISAMQFGKWYKNRKYIVRVV